MNEFSFSGWLRERMKEQGLSQMALAEMTGITLSTICGYMHDRRFPSYQTMKYMAGLFGQHIEIVDNEKERRAGE